MREYQSRNANEAIPINTELHFHVTNIMSMTKDQLRGTSDMIMTKENKTQHINQLKKELAELEASRKTIKKRLTIQRKQKHPAAEYSERAFDYCNARIDMTRRNIERYEKTLDGQYYLTKDINTPYVKKPAVDPQHYIK